MNGSPRVLKRQAGRPAAVAGLLLALLLLASFPARRAGAAERPTTLVGRVLRLAGPNGAGLDAAGSDVAGLRVVVTHIESHARLGATTGADGTFSLEGVPAGRVVVVVESADPNALPEAGSVVDIRGGQRNNVTLIPQSASAPHPQGTAAPTFNFLFYQGEYYNNKTSEAAADPVTVTAPATTSNINMDLSTGGGTIAGRVTADGTNAALPGLVVFAIGQTSLILSFDRTDNNGDFKITGVPADQFYISVNSFLTIGETDYVGEYYNNSLTISGATLVPVAEGQNVTGINFGLAQGGTIAGKVTAEVGGAGLPDVVVYAQGTAPLFLSDVSSTDASGNYTIRGLAAGNYTVQFQPEGNFLAEYYNNKPTGGEADPVIVTAGNTVTINSQLAAAGSITGVVTNLAGGAPLPDQLVIASKVGDPLTSLYAFTLEDGTYLLESLPPGSYTVGIPALSRWFDNKDSAELADPVVVTGGVTVEHIDISAIAIVGCTADPGSRITLGGRVTVGSGAGAPPVADADVYLYISTLPVSPGFPTRFLISSVTTGADGRYMFDCLDETSYFVECAPGASDLVGQWYANADSAGATAIPVAVGSSRTDIDFALQHGGKISGKVTGNGGGTNLAGVRVHAINVATGRTYETVSEQNGTYQIDSGDEGGLATGSYKVWVDDFNTADYTLLPVVLSRFEALPISGGIAIEWTTTEETDHAGFSVYRSTTAQEAPVRLNDRLLTGGPAYRFEDTQVTSGTSYLYWLGAVDRGGREERFGPVTASIGEPGVTKLLGVFPNPLHAQSVIHFALATAGKASVQIFDPSGRLVRTLGSAEYPAGRASVTWDGRRDDGTSARAGVYFVQLTAGGTSGTTKLIVAH